MESFSRWITKVSKHLDEYFFGHLPKEIFMPSKSLAQKRLMAAAAHNPAFAKKVGVPQKVAKEFNRADAAKAKAKKK